MANVRTSPVAVHKTHKQLLSNEFPTTICVVGAGGTGSHMVHGLAALHCALIQLGHQGLVVKVYDQDVVEKHNVGRSKFAWQDAGLNKAQALIAEVNRSYNVAWMAAPEPYRPDMKDSFKLSNILITCVDSGEFRRRVQPIFRNGLKNQRTHGAVQAEHYAMMSTLYWMDLGNEKDFGQVVLGGEGLPTCVEMFPKSYKGKDPKGQPTCSMSDSLKHQDLFINQQIATSALSMLWELFRRGHIRYNAIFVNQHDQRMRPKMLTNDHQEHSRSRAGKAEGRHRTVATGQERTVQGGREA